MAERRSEQGQATINEAVTDGKIFEGSFIPQYKAALARVDSAQLAICGKEAAVVGT